jgi:hypothetical protein
MPWQKQRESYRGTPKGVCFPGERKSPPLVKMKLKPMWQNCLKYRICVGWGGEVLCLQGQMARKMEALEYWNMKLWLYSLDNAKLSNVLFLQHWRLNRGPLQVLGKFSTHWAMLPALFVLYVAFEIWSGELCLGWTHTWVLPAFTSGAAKITGTPMPRSWWLSNKRVRQEDESFGKLEWIRGCRTDLLAEQSWKRTKLKP